jgi:hypothetical protein
MTPHLTAEMRQALGEHPGQPVFVIDEATNQSYVLLPAAAYRKMEELAYDAGEPDPHEFLPAAHKAFADDWDAPGMEVYDDIGRNDSGQ